MTLCPGANVIKLFYGRNSQIFIKSQSVLSWPTFRAYYMFVGQAEAYTRERTFRRPTLG
jgi:hypothetical protein